MKRVKCPKCGHSITFDETRYAEGNTLVFECTECRKQFGIRIGASNVLKTRKEEKQSDNTTDTSEYPYGHVVVVENVFHYQQILTLQMGDNVIGRYVRGSDINQPIETVDPSVDTTHCVINVSRNRRGELIYTLRDAPSGTGSFVGNTILRDNDRLRLNDGTIITIGATTMIFHVAGSYDEETTAEAR